MLEDASVLADVGRRGAAAGLRARVLDAIAREPRTGDAAPVATPLPPPPPPPADAPDHLAPVVPIHRRRLVDPGAAVAAAIVVVGGALVVARDADAADDEIAAVLDADDAVTIPHAGELPAPDDRALGRARTPPCSSATASPSPTDDDVYELWAIRDGTPASMRRRSVRTTTGTSARRTSPASTRRAPMLWAITEEPAGGSDAADHRPILTATA